MKKLLRTLGVMLAATILATGLAACGGKAESNEDQYEYAASFKEQNISLASNGYVSATKYVGDTFYLIENVYDNNSELSKLKLHKVDINTFEDTVEELDKSILGQQAYISSILPDKEGNIYLVTDSWDSETGESKETLLEIKDGKVASEIDLSFLTSDDGWINSECMVKKGDVFIVPVSGTIVGFDKNGKTVFSQSIGYHVLSLDQSEAGEVIAAYYSDNGEGVAIIDEKGEVKSTLEVSNLNNAVYLSDTGKLYVQGDVTAKEIDMNTGESKLLWNWLDTDIDDSGIQSIKGISDNEYRVVSATQSDEGKYTVSIADLTYRKVTAENAKEIIVYGCVDLDGDVKELIRKFNKSSDKYKIKVKDYSEMYDDHEKAEEMFKTDLGTGKIIDFFSLDGSDFEDYKKSKMLKDMTPLFDAEFNRSDFFENVLDIYSKDGKLIGIPSSFSIDSMIVSEKTAAGRTSWTLQDVIELRRENPDKTFMEGADQSSAFMMMLYYTLGEFVDYDKADCKFDSDNFKQLLEFAKTFPKEFDYENYDSWTALKEGDTLIADISIWSPNEIQLYDALLDNKAVLIGFPTDTGSGNRVRANKIFCISSKSKHDAGAWEFIKQFLEEENQKNNWNGLPVLKSAFDAKIAEYMNEDHTSGYGNGYITIELKGLTQAQADKIRGAIETATAGAYYDEKIFEIITEESQAFFEGQKSAEEVAGIVQNRVKLYLQERN